MRIILSNPVAKRVAQREIENAPHGFICTLAEPPRNLNQNAALWAMLSDIAEQVDWYGQRLTKDEWKDVFSASLKRQKVVPGIDGGFVVCGRSTSQMSKSEFSELLEIAASFGSEKNVKFGGSYDC